MPAAHITSEGAGKGMGAGTGTGAGAGADAGAARVGCERRQKCGYRRGRDSLRGISWCGRGERAAGCGCGVCGYAGVYGCECEREC